ncbi:CDP-diacylglycerol--glycerol-3-phosphate 3-phosphatidyltransferase [Kocuria varians]|uniref:CDP-diacylglycerol--glycerol-3-phosphate 3-phosphatidyltransferase n=1 Tax=Kocuria varians TaxID=1272 RepID=A0A4Y4D651_KOCVA|nr:CDP-alcohol phosphatidyltransferase family protein [Kocuria varians]GEC99459.1 CDP-diacylglycerol--glycerol-3-phosphate 3-phosphatidyltransferase [Kocuria varians]
MTPTGPLRRPIPQRSAGWATAAASALQRTGIRPNHVSVASVVTALVGAGCLVVAGHADGALRTVALLLAAVCIPLRLLCNMLDGMLAVEGGLRTPTGDLYNEVPDRLSDLALFVGAGWAASSVAGGVTLGWLAGTLAVFTAYVRTLGVSLGCAQQFGGILPKQRRMWVLMGGILVSLFEPVLGWHPGIVLWLTLVVVVAGCAVTAVTRLGATARELRARG